MFILEGNIGAGKSTFLSLVKKELAIEIAYEPTNQWQNIGSAGNLLDLFYKDMSRWAYTFQSYAFLSRLKALKELRSSLPLLAERSIYCDRFCFAKNCYERGVMSELEWQLYQEWFSWLAKEHIGQPKGFIYLQVSPERCHERLQKRARSEESTVPLSYLQEIHRKHEDWLIHHNEKVDFLTDVPILVIKGDYEFESQKEAKDNLLHQVDTFIKSIILNQQQIKKEEFDKQGSMFSY